MPRRNLRDEAVTSSQAMPGGGGTKTERKTNKQNKKVRVLKVLTMKLCRERTPTEKSAEIRVRFNLRKETFLHEY